MTAILFALTIVLLFGKFINYQLQKLVQEHN